MKCDSEGACRVCKRRGRVEAAHTIGRKHDDKSGKVNPLDIVPLCSPCHRDYDARRISILAVMTYDEQAAAVAHVGIVRALKRLDPIDQ